jgi:ADP-ribosylglycohydrolase
MVYMFVRKYRCRVNASRAWAGAVVTAAAVAELLEGELAAAAEASATASSGRRAMLARQFERTLASSGAAFAGTCLAELLLE